MPIINASRILVVDDERPLLDALVDALLLMGYEVRGEYKQRDALSCIISWQPDVAIFDLSMPGMDGLELTIEAHKIQPDLPVILLTAFGTIESAVSAIRQGVYDYLTKPFDLTVVDLTLQKALDHQQQRRRYRLLSEATSRTEGVVGSSEEFVKLLRSVEAVSSTDSTVLITGENGTGKEVIAHAVHSAGNRKDKPFITVDCAAIPDSLIESELFGHSKGAFTGAHKDREGQIEAAADGTIFLDEIGEIPISLQKKLLRILEEKTYQRVGDTRRRITPARILAATNRDLTFEVKEGRFREDLYYRLKVIELCIPPLRERSDDIPLLVDYYINRLNRKLNRKILSVTPAAMRSLRNYQWPGNVRQLVNLLEQVMTFHNTEILDIVHLPQTLQIGYTNLPTETYKELKERVLTQAGRCYFQALLNHFQGNISKAADYSSINRRHIHRLLTSLGMNTSTFRDS